MHNKKTFLFSLKRKTSDQFLRTLVQIVPNFPVYQYRLQMDYAGGIFIYSTPRQPKQNFNAKEEK